MFKALRKQFIRKSIMELEPGHYYLMFIKEQKDAKEFAEYLNTYFQGVTDAPQIIVISSAVSPDVRIMDIG